MNCEDTSNRDVPKIMLIGLGDLGRVTLQTLAQAPGVGSILVATRNQERAGKYCNLARMSATALGVSPRIDAIPLDLNDHAAVVEAIVEEAPDLVLHTATMLSWWLPGLLPKPQAKRLGQAGFGVWLPVHLTLSQKLVGALRAARFRGHCVTAPFPDVVNCVLGRTGPAPTCGVGNLDELVPKIRLLAAERLEEKVESVRVYLVAHHSLESAVLQGRRNLSIPCFLRIECHGQDVTSELSVEELLWAPYPLPSGRKIHFLTAASTTRLIRALLSETGSFVHAPGPNGLPGGYPVHANRAGVHLVDIPGLTRDEAVSLNEASHRFDGIERIEADGTVVFCDEAADVMRRELGYECRKLRPEESEDRAEELISRFREYAHLHGVKNGF